MKIKMVCLEDGIISCGFRKMAAYSKRLNDDSQAYFISTNAYRDLIQAALGKVGTAGELDEDSVDEIAHGLIDADILGFSSMTGYAKLTHAVIKRVRELSDKPYIIWGGIHPIIHPEDAILGGVDAICVGEGEFAFEQFFDKYKDGRDFTDTHNFWFKKDGKVIKNGFLPLMTPEMMEELPFPQTGENEWIFKKERGFQPLGLKDYLQSNGLSYNTLWSIGCPFHCTYCGNTKFISNDKTYKKLRHPTPKYAVAEIKYVLDKHPHVSTICFHDDSFMAIKYEQLEEFAETWKRDVGLPFAVYGVIPNYVRKDKIEILTWAGMNRIRMGIQSGSQRILDFYKRPTPIHKVENAAEIAASFAPQYQIPPAYDFIMDNPVETKQDVVDTLELAYRLARPYTLNMFSLRVIPNTEMEKAMAEAGVDIEEISANYVMLPPRLANVLMYLVAVWKPPRWLWDKMVEQVESSGLPQEQYPRLLFLSRLMFLTKRGFDHLRFMDFSTIPGWAGYVAWKSGLIKGWLKLKKTMPRPEPPAKKGSRATRGEPIGGATDFVSLSRLVQKPATATASPQDGE